MKIIQQSFYEKKTEVWTPENLEVVRPYQIVVMVSLSIQRAMLPEGSPRFPAIIDTGNNTTFAMRQSQVDRWAKLSLPETGWGKINNEPVRRLKADVWLHPTDDGAPFRLGLDDGISAFPDDDNPFRLPLLGLKALVLNDLTLVMNGKKREVTLKTAGWF